MLVMAINGFWSKLTNKLLTIRNILGNFSLKIGNFLTKIGQKWPFMNSLKILNFDRTPMFHMRRYGKQN